MAKKPRFDTSFDFGANVTAKPKSAKTPKPTSGPTSGRSKSSSYFRDKYKQGGGS